MGVSREVSIGTSPRRCFHAAVLKHWYEVAVEQIIAGIEALPPGQSPIEQLLRRAFRASRARERIRSWATLDPVARAAVGGRSAQAGLCGEFAGSIRSRPALLAPGRRFCIGLSRLCAVGKRCRVPDRRPCSTS